MVLTRARPWIELGPSAAELAAWCASGSSVGAKTLDGMWTRRPLALPEGSTFALAGWNT